MCVYVNIRPYFPVEKSCFQKKKYTNRRKTKGPPSALNLKNHIVETPIPTCFSFSLFKGISFVLSDNVGILLNTKEPVRVY